MTHAELFAAGCSIAPTRRRRFLWAAWWSAPPARDPFRKPDAFQGGARTREEALAQAERTAGVHLVELEPRWARAWARVLVGQPPWLEKSTGEERHGTAPRAKAAPRASVWATLGVTRDATEDDLKRAFRQRALETHPDHGGEAETFRNVQRAYEEARRRVGRPKKRRPRG